MDYRTRLRIIGIVLAIVMTATVVTMGVVAWRQVQAARDAAGR